MTEKNRAVVVPVASVPAFLNPVPHVSVKLAAPLVVMAKVTSCPTVPPLALKVQAPVGVIVRTRVVAMFAVMAPVVAGSAEAPSSPPAGP